jgi:hypothetical protein
MKFKKDMTSVIGAGFSNGGFSIKQYQKELPVARDRILEGSRVVKTAQGRIEYSIAGKGSPVLFIHGAGGGHDMGRLFAGRIGDDFFWICPSMRRCLTICISKKPPLLDYRLGAPRLYYLLCGIQTDVPH